MSDFPYASIPEYQKWTVVSEADDRRALSPQGPVKFTVGRDAEIASAGSCFAQRIAERLPRFGLRYFIAEPKAAPYSARYGNVYSARQLQQLFDRAFGRFDPLERAWETPDGRFLDPFRPTVEEGGFASIEALETDRTEHLAAVARLFRDVDVFVFTLGLTEIWSDARDGAVFPTCPGRGRGTFDAERHVFSNLDVAETCAALDAFVTSLGEVNPKARVILTVSPVAIAATMEPMHVVRASILTKSVLKVAAETTARRYDNVDYFAAYDAVNANLGNEQLFAPDGRHVIDAVADRTVQLLVASYVDAPEANKTAGADTSAAEPVATESVALELADDCDEDRLLKLLERDRARKASNGNDVHAGGIAHPIPLFFAGDSGVLGFRNCVFSVPGYRQTFVGCALHTFALKAGELTDRDGQLNATLLSQLLSANLLAADGDGYRLMADYVHMLNIDEERFRFDPPLVLCCGAYDVANFRLELGQNTIALPPERRPAGYAGPHVGDISFDEAKAIANELLVPFDRGLRLLQSYGFVNLAVHMIPPPGPELSLYYANNWFDLDVPYAATIVMNATIEDVCARTGVGYVDIWDRVVGEDGLRDTRYTLDTAHLNYEASTLSVRRLLELLDERPVRA